MTVVLLYPLKYLQNAYVYTPIVQYRLKLVLYVKRPSITVNIFTTDKMFMGGGHQR